jgi:lipopolysaccharide biosynthesis protein
LKWLFAGAKYLAKVTIHTVRYWSNKVIFSIKNVFKARTESPISSTDTKVEQKISIVFHAYHLELAKQIICWIEDFAKKVDLPVSLIVTTSSENQTSIQELTRSTAYKAEVIEVENHGRDIWPFLQVCQSGKLSNSVLVLKIHTKAPRMIARAVELNAESVHQLLDPELVDGLLSKAKETGMFVATFEKYVGRTASWGLNIKKYFSLISKLGISPLPTKLRFPAGTIFWTTGTYADYLGKLTVESSDFEGEPSPDDGATEHVLERLFGMLAKDNGGVIPLERLVTGEQNANRNSRN